MGEIDQARLGVDREDRSLERRDVEVGGAVIGEKGDRSARCARGGAGERAGCRGMDQEERGEESERETRE